MCGVQPLRRRLGDAGEETTGRVLLAEREEPLQQTALVHHLDAARMQAERADIVGRLRLLLQHDHVHTAGAGPAEPDCAEDDAQHVDHEPARRSPRARCRSPTRRRSPSRPAPSSTTSSWRSAPARCAATCSRSTACRRSRWWRSCRCRCASPATPRRTTRSRACCAAWPPTSRTRSSGCRRSSASSLQAKELSGKIKDATPRDFSIFGAPVVLQGAIGLYGRSGLADRLPPPANVVISNVPGPQTPLYVAGAKVLTLYPVSIPAHGMALNLTVQSYCGALDFGLTACRKTVPELRKLAGYLEESLDELHEAVLGAAAAAPAQARRAPRRRSAAQRPPRPIDAGEGAQGAAGSARRRAQGRRRRKAADRRLKPSLTPSSTHIRPTTTHRGEDGDDDRHSKKTAGKQERAGSTQEAATRAGAHRSTVPSFGDLGKLVEKIQAAGHRRRGDRRVAAQGHGGAGRGEPPGLRRHQGARRSGATRSCRRRWSSGRKR